MRAAALALVAVLAGCQTRSFELVRRGDAGNLDGQARLPGEELDGGATDVVGDARTDVPDGCAPRPEQCNGLDDNCNGLVDEGIDFNTDPKNCGRCGVECTFPNAVAACSIGRCKLDACKEAFVDLDRQELNGCECEQSNGGVEICDNKDNDCNGKADDGFDLQNSIEDCGTCGRKCEYPHAGARCAAGACEMLACVEGFLDLDRNPRTGCEYPCVPSGVEICDGKDNDCNGDVDESDARVGQPCWPEGMQGCDVTTGQCMGFCQVGKYACLPGGLICMGAVLPKSDICDGLDNNCNGVADEDFDLQNDPRWCGACNRVCELPNVVPGCVAGACVIRTCKTGFVNLDGQLENGCEYACSPDGPEVCDGKDNDCDGLIDLDDPDLLYPLANFCAQAGECGKGPGGSARYPEPTFPVCMQAAGAVRPDWVCNYPATVQLFAPNQIQGEETWCDGLDNDCDGMVDEHALIGGPCTDNGLGECKKRGVYRCQADKTLAPTCDVAGAPEPTPTDEVCDGKDNDCDGSVDESWDNPSGFPQCGGGDCKGVRDDVVHVTVLGADYYIYQNEASRVDASAMVQGIKETRACSRNPGGGLLPWTLVTIARARTACAGAGMRLCRVTRSMPCSSAQVLEDEWGLACSAGLTCPDGPRQYPYACAYDPSICQGADRGADVVPTGALQCTTSDLDGPNGGEQVSWDMSGNVAEWTEDCRGTLSDGSGRKAYTLRGGSFTSVAQALRCDFMSLAVAENFTFNDTGFRCCSSCPPGLADCGQCVSLATDRGNCGACGKVCEGGLTCQNGICR